MKRVGISLLTVGLIVGMVALLPLAAVAGNHENGTTTTRVTGGGQEQFIICHATGSETHPFEVIVTAQPSVVAAHEEHQNEGDEIFGPFTGRTPSELRRVGAELCAAPVATTTTVVQQPTTTVRVAPRVITRVVRRPVVVRGRTIVRPVVVRQPVAAAPAAVARPLPFTGIDPSPFLTASGLLMSSGGGLLVAARRRRRP